ncbi:RrF2 family transcriptional regulator [Kiritimatiella glycovorans]|uniref:Rrf2 family transcriptional regulator n=1 Tax=Kiritimatiella glycovorans TaxID=1307763 RepID=A0A0G3EHL0_9BACT|nr:Rrf2 family transcriptional regulator [Kiritimatiella glycovorans]AKJ64907.1 Rrf2 family transcriptional regulator [Kiritimatiella glycovorans]
MSGIIKVSEAVSLALHSVLYLARRGQGPVRTQEIADTFGVSVHHLAKVHQRLVRVGILRSNRGPRGGVVLDRDPAELTLLELYESMEGRLESGPCVFGRPVCDRHECLFGDLVSSINRQAREYFGTTTIGDLAKGWKGKEEESESESESES